MEDKMTMSADEFSARLAALGLSQSAFARCVQAKQVSISRYMSGTSPVPEGLAEVVRELESRVRECARLEAKNLRAYGKPYHGMVAEWLLEPEFGMKYDLDLGAIFETLGAVVRGRAYGEVDGDGVPAGTVLA